MAKSYIHKVLALLLASLILVTSTGISMDMHFCQNQIKSISLIGEANACHEKPSLPPCHQSTSTTNKTGFDVHHDDCCHNSKVVIEKTSTHALPHSTLLSKDVSYDFVIAFISIFVHKAPVENRQQKAWLFPKPPLISTNFQILYQTFLI